LLGSTTENVTEGKELVLKGTGNVTVSSEEEPGVLPHCIRVFPISI